MRIRKYSELRSLSTFEERFEYLALRGTVGVPTFGSERYINQRFYRSREWRDIRDHVIARDEGRDLAVEGFEIHGLIIIHHMNPMTPKELIHGDSVVLEPDYLICTTHNTHNAIHYGDKSLLLLPSKPRTPGDTRLW